MSTIVRHAKARADGPSAIAKMGNGKGVRNVTERVWPMNSVDEQEEDLVCDVHGDELVDGTCGICYDNEHRRYYGEDFVWELR